MTNIITALLLAATLTACATTRGDNPPIEVWHFPGNYKTLAVCLYATQEEKADGYRVFYFDYEGMDKARVWSEGKMITGGTTGTIGFEVRFIQTASGVDAEYWRPIPTERWHGIIKSDLDTCANRTLTKTPFSPAPQALLSS